MCEALAWWSRRSWTELRCQLPTEPPCLLQLLNGVIERACAAGSPGAAQSAFEHMCQAGVPPTVATFAALLAALRRQHTPAEVAELAVGLAGQADAAGGAPGAALLAVFEACQAHAWCDMALPLLAAVEAAGSSLTVELIDAALAACAASGAVDEVRGRELPLLHGACKGPAGCQRSAVRRILPPPAGPCPQALQAFGRLAQQGLSPSPASRQHLAEAQAAAGRWADVVQGYEELLQAG